MPRRPRRREASPRAVRAARGAPRCRAPRPARLPASAARARSCSAHRGSTKSRRVRRSERRRRVATRAWCTASGSRSVQSAGSLASRRATDVRDRRPHDVGDALAVGLRHGQASTLRAFVRAIARSCSATCASSPLTTGTFDPGAVGFEAPRERVVGEVELEDLVEAGAQPAVGDAQHRLDAAIEVAGHHVGRSDDVLGVVAPGCAEPEDARVLEEPADDRAHGDALGHAGNAGAQAADAAHDDVDARAGDRRGVELVDDLRVDERVHLHRDHAAGTGLAADQRPELVAQVHRRDEQPAVLAGPAVAGQVVEQLARCRRRARRRPRARRGPRRSTAVFGL